MPQQTMFYQFAVHQDLTYKANTFISKINELGRLGYDLQTFIQNETANEMGEIIETINETIQKQEEINRLYHDAYEIVMKNMANHYSNHIADINTQKLTLYYKIINNDD